MEFANDEPDETAKEKHYLDAIGKFSRIVLDFPESEFAPRSQYKKALAFEKMGMLDQASEEYVKLSYQYPDHELIAETIVRLGQYFWQKARDIEKANEALVNSGDDQERIDGEKAMREARDIFRTAAEVFGRLSARFPEHVHAIIKFEPFRIGPGKILHLTDLFTIRQRAGPPERMFGEAPIETGFTGRIVIVVPDPVGTDPANIVTEGRPKGLLRIHPEIIAINFQGFLVRIPQPQTAPIHRIASQYAPDSFP